MSFSVYPAIDVRAGRVVRLRQGDYARETDYGMDPFTLACKYADAGATWLHLVDLDAARSGGYGLEPLVRAIATHSGLSIQTGGGVRSEADVERLLEAGATRVVIGSLAVREPESVAHWITRYGSECITVALDMQRDAKGRWRLPVHGWMEASGENPRVLLRAFADSGLRHVLCTDIGRDGMLSGPNIDLYRELLKVAPWIELQASGGIRNVSDLGAIQGVGCCGAILGRALLEQSMHLPEVLAC